MDIKGFILQEPPYTGGMAVVYKGTKGAFTRAFKMVRPDKVANNPRLCERFFHEIQVQQTLDHPNIIKMLDAYAHPDASGYNVTVIEMEWLNGMDLQRYIEKKKPKGLEPEEVMKIARRVSEGLRYAHQRNVLHLDIKPSNIFRTVDGYIKIIDFGIAKVMGENIDIMDNADNLNTVTDSTTGETSFKGTPAYASPEQQMGGTIGPWSDVYSFGNFLRFVLTGTTDPAATIAHPLLRAIITKCTQQNPNSRYRNFDEVLKALDGPAPTSLKCPGCHTDNLPDGTKFCPQCGTELKPKPRFVTCKKCGALVNSAQTFCSACGTKVSDIDVPKKITGYKCKKCGKTNKAYSDGKNKFCNFCGATQSNLSPIYE